MVSNTTVQEESQSLSYISLIVLKNGWSFDNLMYDGTREELMNDISNAPVIKFLALSEDESAVNTESLYVISNEISCINFIEDEIESPKGKEGRKVVDISSYRYNNADVTEINRISAYLYKTLDIACEGYDDIAEDIYDIISPAVISAVIDLENLFYELQHIEIRNAVMQVVVEMFLCKNSDEVYERLLELSDDEIREYIYNSASDILHNESADLL